MEQALSNLPEFEEFFAGVFQGARFFKVVDDESRNQQSEDGVIGFGEDREGFSVGGHGLFGAVRILVCVFSAYEELIQHFENCKRMLNF